MPAEFVCTGSEKGPFGAQTFEDPVQQLKEKFRLRREERETSNRKTQLLLVQCSLSTQKTQQLLNESKRGIEHSQQLLQQTAALLAARRPAENQRLRDVHTGHEKEE
jgi:uncharacterized membrane protein YccC